MRRGKTEIERVSAANSGLSDKTNDCVNAVQSAFPM